MLQQLSVAYGELDRDPELRAGLVFAHGEHFTAGLDLADVSAHIGPAGLDLVPEDGIHPWGMDGRPVSKPVVLAVQGTCLTLGVELALASDIVVAADSTRFGQIEVQRGILPFGGATTRFAARVGWGDAMRWMLTGDTFDAAEAHRIGLVQEVVPHGEQYERGLALARAIAAQAPLAVQATLANARLAVREGAAAAEALPAARARAPGVVGGRRDRAAGLRRAHDGGVRGSLTRARLVVASEHDCARIRPDRHRSRDGRRERRRLRQEGRPERRPGRGRAGRRRVLVLGVHAVEGAAARRERPARGTRRRRCLAGGDRRRGSRGGVRAPHHDRPRLGRRVAGEVGRLDRDRPGARPRPVHRRARRHGRDPRRLDGRAARQARRRPSARAASPCFPTSPASPRSSRGPATTRPARRQRPRASPSWAAASSPARWRPRTRASARRSR